MVNKYFMYEKAHGAHGFRDKHVRLANGMRDLVASGIIGIAGIGPAGPRPTLHIGGVHISISSEFDLDMSSVLPVFANLPAEFDAIHGVGGMAPNAPWPDTNIVPACDMLMFLCRRVVIGRLDRGNVLTDFRNGLMQLVGAMAERQGVYDVDCHEAEGTPTAADFHIRQARQEAREEERGRNRADVGAG